MPQASTLERPATAVATIVTPDNFVRAETDMYFANAVRDAGGVGRLHHHRTLMPIDAQAVIRANRDTLYSVAVFDLDAGPATVIMPEAGGRFMSLMVLDEDHYVHDVVYGAGSHTLTRAAVGTRYVLAGIRTLVDPQDPGDVAKVHALQDAIVLRQTAPGAFEPPAWDRASQDKVRKALIALGETMPDTRGAFGAKDAVDPVAHLIGSAIAWGGNPKSEALYLNVTPAKNDGRTVYRLTVRDVPVDAFWSISVYNAVGYFEPNPQNAYSLNNLTAKKDADGAVTIQFGGCDGSAANCLPTPPGWNYLVRLYRPRPEVLDGSWTFPEARPVD